LDAWEARVSNLSGGNNAKLVQALQDVIDKARSVDMATITNPRKTPIANAANKDALLKEARTIKAEVQALLKTASKSGVEEVPKLVKKTQTVVNATSILAQNVDELLYILLAPLVIVLLALYLLLFALDAIFCCDYDGPDCKPRCEDLVFMPFTILTYVLYAIIYIIRTILALFSGQQRLSNRDGDGGTCFDKLFSCQYDSVLLAVMPTSIDLVEQLG